MTSQYEKFKALSDEDLDASIEFWTSLMQMLHGNAILYEYGLAPKLIQDMQNYDDYDEFLVRYNTAVLLGTLRKG